MMKEPEDKYEELTDEWDSSAGARSEWYWANIVQDFVNWLWEKGYRIENRHTKK